jgi:glycosyltransferase involved in cell wall biosynthesis
LTRHLIYLVTEDWYFLSHRLAVARAAREAGFRVGVATRVVDGADAIRAEGFELHRLDWQRGLASPGELLASAHAVARLYRRERPDIVHHVALKPILIGGLARIPAPVPVAVNAVTGLGSTLIESGGARGLPGRGVRAVLPRVLNQKGAVTIIQNQSDGEEIARLGADPSRFVLIRGSGIDLTHHVVLPEPDGPVTVGIAARMIEDKGVRPLVEAVRRVRREGLDLRLLLAGDTDTENPTAIPRAELEGWARADGITWLGHVSDIRSLWARCHVAVLPSRREGLPKALLEAAAAGRPIVATDVPGCREVAVQDVNALLVPIDDPAALAAALARLARDPALRSRMAQASRRLVESDLSADAVARRTVELYRTMLAAIGRG